MLCHPSLPTRVLTGVLLTLTAAHLGCAARAPLRRPASNPAAVALSVAELKERIRLAQPGELIRVDRNTTYDLTQEPPIAITIPGLTIRSEPAAVEGLRARFYSAGKPFPLFDVSAPGVTFEGVLLEGVETDAKKEEIIALNNRGIRGVYQFPVTRGIRVAAPGFTIRNSELLGFSHAAIFIEGGTGALVENNSIHHCQRWGLGYGVALHQAATATIRGNRFNFNRHSIAGSGIAGQSYEAFENTFGPDHNASPLDMHGGKDRGDGTNIAGRRVEIHHNVIEGSGVKAFIHRGIAEEAVLIHHNHFVRLRSQDEAIGWYNIGKQDMPPNKYQFFDNRFGDP